MPPHQLDCEGLKCHSMFKWSFFNRSCVAAHWNVFSLSERIRDGRTQNVNLNLSNALRNELYDLSGITCSETARVYASARMQMYSLVRCEHSTSKGPEKSTPVTWNGNLLSTRLERRSPSGSLHAFASTSLQLTVFSYIFVDACELRNQPK